MVVTVNGEPCALRPLAEGDVAPGAMVRCRQGRRVYRVLCEDGPDVVMRNARHPELFDACPRSSMPGLYDLVVPFPR